MKHRADVLQDTCSCISEKQPSAFEQFSPEQRQHETYFVCESASNIGDLA